MFTGLVHGQGVIETLEHMGEQCRIRVCALYDLAHIVQGESIAVNGGCLTVERFSGVRFEAYASAETMSRTTLGQRRVGEKVNLERALAMGDRLGGHIVSGHVDCVAHVVRIQPSGASRKVVIHFPDECAPEVVEKGSITLDGISLTINACTHNTLDVNIIPETWAATTAATWSVGTLVNMETDILGKYVRRNMQCMHMPTVVSSTDISMELLRENGFV